MIGFYTYHLVMLLRLLFEKATIEMMIESQGKILRQKLSNHEGHSPRWLASTKVCVFFIS